MPTALGQPGGEAVRARRLRHQRQPARDEHLASARAAVPTRPEDADPRVGGPRCAYINAFGLTGPDGLRRDVAAEVSVREAADLPRGPGEPPSGRARVSVLGRDGWLGALRGDQPAKRSWCLTALRA